MPQQMPKPGDVINFHKFIGGDPSDPGNWQPLQGEEYLSRIPAQRANIVRGLLQGRLPYPNTRATKPDAFSNQLLVDAAMADPGFDATVYKTRQQMQNDFRDGKTANVIRALVQGIGHMKSMSDGYDALGNTGYGGFNAVRNAVMPALGDQRLQGALGAVNTAREAVSPELATILRGGQAAEEDVQSWRNVFGQNAEPARSKASLAEAVDLLHSRLESLQHQWKNGMGPLGGDFPMLSPEAVQSLDALRSRYTPQYAGQQPQRHAPNIPAGAVQMLRANPTLAPQFDSKYGAGASASLIGR